MKPGGKAAGGYFWTAPAIAELRRLARAGGTWEAIGRRFYPAAPAKQAAVAACEVFRRHATDADRAARRLAVRARNGNRVPGLSARAERRRRQAGRNPGRDPGGAAVLPELRDPWVGMGECFR